MLWGALLVLVPFTLQFTLPSFDAYGGPGEHEPGDPCGESTMAIDDLDSVFVAVSVRWSGRERIVHRASVQGLAGQPYAVEISVPADTQATVLVWTTDSWGNRSCAAFLGLNQTTGVEYSRAAAPADTSLFDLAGRRVVGTARPGVYFRRIGPGCRGRVVVIR